MLRELIRADVAQHLLNGESIPAQSRGEFTVLFADLVHFTELAEILSPVHLVELLNAIFSDIDSLSERNGIEKITVRSRFLALRAGCHCFQGDRDDAVGKARVEWAMPDEQPVEDGTVDHVEQHLEVLLQRDLPPSGSLEQHGATGLAAREDDLVAEGLGEFAFGVGGRERHGDLAPSGRRKGLDQRSHLPREGRSQTCSAFCEDARVSGHQGGHGEFGGVRPMPVDRWFPHTGPRGNGLDGQTAKPVLRQDVVRRFQDCRLRQLLR